MFNDHYRAATLFPLYTSLTDDTAVFEIQEPLELPIALFKVVSFLFSSTIPLI